MSWFESSKKKEMRALIEEINRAVEQLNSEIDTTQNAKSGTVYSKMNVIGLKFNKLLSLVRNNPCEYFTMVVNTGNTGPLMYDMLIGEYIGAMNMLFSEIEQASGFSFNIISGKYYS